jgi:hypothetical protein
MVEMTVVDYVMDVMHAKFVLIQLWKENAQIGVKKNAWTVLYVMVIQLVAMKNMEIKIIVKKNVIIMERDVMNVLFV